MGDWNLKTKQTREKPVVKRDVMKVARFDLADVVAIIRHAANAKKVRKGTPRGRRVMLVCDSGLYLMSAAVPEPGTSRCDPATFAWGCHPDRDADYRAAARAIFSIEENEDGHEHLRTSECEIVAEKCQMQGYPYFDVGLTLTEVFLLGPIPGWSKMSKATQQLWLKGQRAAKTPTWGRMD